MDEQKPAVFPLDIATLIATNRFADRFSYSTYFVPVLITFKDDGTDKDTPILTFPQRAGLARFQGKLADRGQLRTWLTNVGLPKLAERNQFQIVANPPATLAAPAPTAPGTPVAPGTPGPGHVGAPPVVGLPPKSDAVVPPKIGEIGPGTNVSTPGTSIDQGQDLLLTLIQSEIGYLFLDRTRIRPKGFAVGEHIYSLSLTPAEEVTLEQKTYSKRTVTMEEANESEQTLDLELASTLTSELNESMDRTQTLTDKWGLSASHTGSYKSPEFYWGSFNASHTVGYTKDVTSASSETARRSLKDTQSTSSKISAKYRSLHKTTFSLKTETGFETSSKRVIRNPNRFTPVDYHFFKILRVVELARERYGTLLCWAPYIKDPAAQFFSRLKAGKAQIIADAESKLPEEPQAPVKPGGPQTQTQRQSSDQVEADKWGWTGDMSADFTLSIAIPQGWSWDRNTADVTGSLKTSTVNVSKGVSASVVGDPWVEDGQLKVIVHVGCKTSYDRGDVGKSSHIYLMVSATFTQTSSDPVADANYNTAFADYVTRHKDWEDSVAKARADAATAADTWEQTMLDGSNPVNELVNRLITEHFAIDVRDEGAEIDLWQRIFQWDGASYVLFPGWWSDQPIRDPLGDPGSFFNASWARLFLPIREGMETTALRWIYSKTSQVPLEPGFEQAVDAVIKDLNAYRAANFSTTSTAGATSGDCPTLTEHYVCLGRWEDTLPTDGTHVEVTQSASLSIDSFAKQDLEDTAALRGVVLDSRKQDVEIKKKAVGGITGAPTVEVKIRTDAPPETSNS
jgi:hypothetical protein